MPVAGAASIPHVGSQTGSHVGSNLGSYGAAPLSFKDLVRQLASAYETLETENKALVQDNLRLQKLFLQKPGQRDRGEYVNMSDGQTGGYANIAGAANPSKVGASARPLLGLPMDRDGTGTAGFESEDPSEESTRVAQAASPLGRARSGTRNNPQTSSQPKVAEEALDAMECDSGDMIESEDMWMISDLDRDWEDEDEIGLDLRGVAKNARDTPSPRESPVPNLGLDMPKGQISNKSSGSVKQSKILAMLPSHISGRLARLAGGRKQQPRLSSQSAASGMLSNDFGSWKDVLDGWMSQWPQMYVRSTESHDEKASVDGSMSVCGWVGWSWVMIICLVLIYELWKVPLQAVFLKDEGDGSVWQFLGFVADGVLIADFFLALCGGFVCTDAVSCWGRLRLYLRSWFIFDLVGSYPAHIIAYVYDDDATGSSTDVSSYLVYLRFIRVLKMGLLYSQRRMSSAFGPHFLALCLEIVAILSAWVHIHGCIWAFFVKSDGSWPQWKEDLRIVTVFDEYITALWWAWSSLTNESPFHVPDTAVRMLEVVIETQRVLLVIFTLRMIMVWVLIVNEEEVNAKRIETDIGRLLTSHDVSRKMQQEVMWHVHQFLMAKAKEDRFQRLMQQEIPKEVLGRFCLVAWSRHLLSLSLFVRISHFHQKFIQAMAMQVTEAVYPEGVLLFRRGDTATGAFCVISGLVGYEMQGHDPPFSPGMWIGEKSLVVGARKRSGTCKALRHSTLMFVATQALRDVLNDLGIYTLFEQLCADEVWRGLCGRCGSLGDHFTKNCPFHVGLAMRKKKGVQIATKGTVRKGAHKVLTNTSITSVASIRSQNSNRGSRMQGSLVAYIREAGLQRLEEPLMVKGVQTFDDLASMDMDSFKAQLAESGDLLSDEETTFLQREAVNNHRERLRDFTRKMLSTTAPDHHLIFLSHAKAEAGVECVLLRTELEAAFTASPPAMLAGMSKPVFLDTEDLQNLKEIQTHVRKSLNMFLVLTPTVLERAWCLVELATAIDSGVQVVLVELVKKRGAAEFKVPREEYYTRLRNGEVLDKQGMEVLEQSEISLEQVERAVREAFNQIALPYSPQRNAAIRKQELSTLIDQCRGMK